MRLRAERSMAVTVHDLGLVVEFAAGEEMRTEISAKFRHRRPGRRAGRRRVGAAADLGRPAGAVRVGARRSGVGPAAQPGASGRAGAERVGEDGSVQREAGDEIAPSRVASFHLVREPAWRAPARARPARHGPAAPARHPRPALRPAARHRPRGRRRRAPTSPAARCSPSGTTPPRSPRSRTAGSPRGRRGCGRAGERCTASALALLSGHGRWGGRDVLADLRPAAAARPPDGPGRRPHPRHRPAVALAPVPRRPGRRCRRSSPGRRAARGRGDRGGARSACRRRSASGPTSPPSSRSRAAREHRDVVRRTRERALVRRGAVRPLRPAGRDGHLGRA